MMATEKLVLGSAEKKRINWGDLLDEAWGSSDQHKPEDIDLTDSLSDHHPDKENVIDVINTGVRTSTPKKSTLRVTREGKVLKSVVIRREKLQLGLSSSFIRGSGSEEKKLVVQTLGPKLGLACHQRMSSSVPPPTPPIPGNGGGRRRCNTVALTIAAGSKRHRRQRQPKQHETLKQLCLDLGQKNFGHVTCRACGMVYSLGETQDEADHSKFHTRFMAGVSFHGWKNERVVERFLDGRILAVFPSDGKHHLRKVRELCSLVDSELGYAEGVSPWQPTTKMYLYVSTSKKIMGCIFAERITEGYPVLGSCTEASDTSDKPKTLSTKSLQEGSRESGHLDSQSAWYCSTTPNPAVVGVNRVWVSRQFRRRGVATRILDTIRFNFISGSVISKEEIAFSDPTPSGKAFATSYCETQNFLVYHWNTSL